MEKKISRTCKKNYMIMNISLSTETILICLISFYLIFSLVTRKYAYGIKSLFKKIASDEDAKTSMNQVHTEIQTLTGFVIAAMALIISFGSTNIPENSLAFLAAALIPLLVGGSMLSNKTKVIFPFLSRLLSEVGILLLLGGFIIFFESTTKMIVTKVFWAGFIILLTLNVSLQYPAYEEIIRRFCDGRKKERS